MTRGGRKLLAAVGRFGLAERIRGARVVDVGAGTGGFTGVLLAHGAAHVTAIDVGHGQLAATLRADHRVLVLEKADFKTLALGVAPGPFDFFTVDVSFVAGRNMLRGLAFRLRPGAVGVVLLKPQFELPDRLVKGGVTDPALRARALAAFSARAAALGFEVLAHADSPVPGGEGTVEILLHARFAGRTARLPAPGEKRGQPPRARAPAAVPASADRLAWFAVAAPGLEEVVRDEVAALPGVADVRLTGGGVEFGGAMEVGLRANLWLRVATRVLLRRGAVEARAFPELRRRVARLPWRDVVPPDAALVVTAAASRCRLYHTGALAENAFLAIADALGRALPRESGAAGAVRVLIRGHEDRFTLSVDASGELLHRRGWRAEGGPAPLRETLAAGILRLAGHDPAEAFLDPMCGAGTIALEACSIALDLAPGLGRAFACQRWPAFDPALAERLRAEARARARDRPPAPIFAWDRDPAAVAAARRNAERAGLAGHVAIDLAAFGQRTPPAPRGLLAVNPPYGRRLGGNQGRVFKELARHLGGAFAGWRAAVLLPETPAGRAFRLDGGRDLRLRNGGLRVRLVTGGPTI